MPTIGTNVAVIRDGHVLLTRREDVEMWCLPGGGVEPGESIAQCAIREVREETGLDVHLTRLVGIYSRPDWNRGGNHVVVLAAEPTGGTLRPAPGEVVDLRYFAPHDLPDDLMWSHRRRIADAFDPAGSRVWTQDMPWPFNAKLTREQLYALRDQKQLSRPELYRRYFGAPGPGGEVLEVGPPGRAAPPAEAVIRAHDWPRPRDVCFDPVAEAYDAYRTGYSDQLYRWILGDDDPSTLRILDVGAGTGIASLELARRGARVVSIDSAEEMLARGRARAQAEDLAVTFICAKAETFQAEPASFDRIVCGQAFHWLEPDVVCPLWQRLIRPGGKIAVFRKSPAPGNPFGPIIDPIYQTYMGWPYHHGGQYREPFSETKFPDLRCHFPDGYPLIHFYDLTTDVTRYVGYLSSLGSVKNMLGDRHAAFLAKVEAALRAEFGDGEFTIRHQESLYLIEQF